MNPEQVSISLGEDYPEIRESVRRICADFLSSVAAFYMDSVK